MYAYNCTQLYNGYLNIAVFYLLSLICFALFLFFLTFYSAFNKMVLCQVEHVKHYCNEEARVFFELYLEQMSNRLMERHCATFTFTPELCNNNKSDTTTTTAPNIMHLLLLYLILLARMCNCLLFQVQSTFTLCIPMYINKTFGPIYFVFYNFFVRCSNIYFSFIISFRICFFFFL